MADVNFGLINTQAEMPLMRGLAEYKDRQAKNALKAAAEKEMKMKQQELDYKQTQDRLNSKFKLLDAYSKAGLPDEILMKQIDSINQDFQEKDQTGNVVFNPLGGVDYNTHNPQTISKAISGLWKQHQEKKINDEQLYEAMNMLKDTYGSQTERIGAEIKSAKGILEPSFEEKQRMTMEYNVEGARRKTELGVENGDKQYAPDMGLRHNADTKETIRIDERDPIQRTEAEAKGFYPVGPEAQGFLTEQGKGGAKRAEEIISASNKAQQNIMTLDSMDQLLDRFKSGKIAGWEKSIQQWGDALGFQVDTKNLGSKEAFTAMGEQLALQSRNLGEGMVLAGQMSDRDVQFLRDMNPQLLISKGGNKIIIKIRKEMAKRSIEISKLLSEYRKQHHGVVDSVGFDEYIRDKLSGKSVFGIPEGSQLAGYDNVTGLPLYRTQEGKLVIPNF